MLRKTNTSGYRGVRKVGKDHWYAQIHINKEQNIYLGTFNSPEDATRVYDRAAVDHWGNHAKLNFPLEDYDKALAYHRSVCQPFELELLESATTVALAQD